jgi:hypothetical protein
MVGLYGKWIVFEKIPPAATLVYSHSNNGSRVPVSQGKRWRIAVHVSNGSGSDRHRPASGSQSPRVMCDKRHRVRSTAILNRQDKEHFMIRKHDIRKRLIVTIGLALVSSFAFADDSSMSVLTGDSYAYFNNLDNNPGRFNTARAPQVKDTDTAMKKPRLIPQTAEKPILLADRPRITLPSPFSDDKGA